MSFNKIQYYRNFRDLVSGLECLFEPINVMTAISLTLSSFCIESSSKLMFLLLGSLILIVDEATTEAIPKMYLFFI